jgi:1-deoxy-D-xylulose-5-phosphate synthase
MGKGVVRKGGKDVALVCYGTMTNNALAAAEMLEKSGVTATVADMRCVPQTSQPILA